MELDGINVEKVFCSNKTLQKPIQWCKVRRVVSGTALSNRNVCGDGDALLCYRIQ